MSDLRRPADLTCDEVRELAGAFVLGALREEDAAAVRAHLDTCPDAHAEILALAEMLPVLAASVPPVEPSAGLRDRLIAAAAADLEARAAPAPAPTVQSGSMGAVTPKPESIEGGRTRRPWSAPAWALRVAAVVAIVVLGGWNLLLQGQLGDAQAYERQVANVLAVAAKQGSLTVVMTPGSAPATGLAAIDAGGRMTLAMHDLAKPSGTPGGGYLNHCAGTGPVIAGTMARMMAVTRARRISRNYAPPAGQTTKHTKGTKLVMRGVDCRRSRS